MPSPRVGLDERRLRGTLIAASIMFLGVQIDFFALNMALPDMASDLGVSVADLQWVLSAYMIAVASTFIVMGRLGDILGRKRVLLVATALFGLASLAGGAAPNEIALIVARAVQGVGAAGMVTVGIATVTNAFPKARVGGAIGIVYTAGGVGSALGPLIGGLLTTFVSWRLVLLVNVPMTIVLAVMVIASVDESRDETVPKRIDYAGIALLAGGLVLATLGVDSAQEAGWISLETLVPIVVGVAMIAAFLLVEGRVRVPLVDLHVFRNHPFNVVTLAGAAAQLPWVGTIFLSAIYLQDVRDLSAAGAGAIFLPMSVGAAIAGYYSGRLGRFLPQQIMAGALVVGGIGVIAVGLIESWIPYALALLVTGLGAGLGFAYASVGTQTVVRPERAGEASGVVFTVIVSISAIVVATLSTLLARGTGGELATSPDLDGLIAALMASLGGISIVAGVITLLTGRITREEITEAQGG